MKCVRTLVTLALVRVLVVRYVLVGYNNTNIENVALKFAILLILMYNIFRTLAIEYMELRLVNSSLVKYSLFCIVVLFKYNIQIKVAV